MGSFFIQRFEVVWKRCEAEQERFEVVRKCCEAAHNLKVKLISARNFLRSIDT